MKEEKNLFESVKYFKMFHEDFWERFRFKFFDEELKYNEVPAQIRFGNNNISICSRFKLDDLKN